MNEFNRKTGVWLKAKRKNAKITQKTVNQLLGKGDTFTHDIEAGRQNILFNDLLKIIELYQADITELSNYVNDKKGND